MVDFFYLFKDINFQKGVLLVATFILLMVILNTAYKLKKEGVGDNVNPIVAPCPDFWDLSGNYCINTNGKNLGFEGTDEYSIWRREVSCENVSVYRTTIPTICDNGLRAIPIGTMYYRGRKTNELIGGGTKNGIYQDIKKKRAKASRTIWANKYGFAWDGLKTRW